jgi:hypothetical protein
MVPQGEVIPQLPVSCLAAFVAKGGRSPESILRPYKFRENAEGRARIICHPPAIALIRRFYKLGKDVMVLDSATAEWRRKVCATDNRSVHARLLSNIVAIDSFRVHLADRDFEILPIHRISCQVGPLVFAASPDLWVKENGEERLIRIGFGKKDRSYIDTLLIIMRRAAIIRGHNILPQNAVYLHASTGQELVSRFSYGGMVLTLTAAAREIAETWPKVTRKSGIPSRRTRAASAGS